MEKNTEINGICHWSDNGKEVSASIMEGEDYDSGNETYYFYYCPWCGTKI